MASNATLTVNIPAPDGSIIKVDVKAPSETTLSLRKKVDKFIRASYVIWKALPSSQTRLVATPEVLDEVIQNATAFHATEQGIVNMVWIKKDMPMEGLKYREVGYWRDGAGPAARTEQYELQHCRAIPEPIMDYIRRSQDHNLISHYLYAFIDFWLLILLHLLTWLACLFWYGYLCILCPILIIGESSKLLNLLLRLPPRLLFREDLLEQDFLTFLNGVFTLDFLKSLCITTSFKEWEELEMDSDDFLQAIGVPIVIQYGPLAHHYGIYIPKYHPYGANHILSVGVDMDRLDRQTRRLAELATRIVNAAPAFPLDGHRKAKLIKLRHFIMAEAQKLGILTELDALKNNMRQTNIAFRGTQQVAAIRNTGVNNGAGQNPNAIHCLTSLRAEDEKLSDGRKAWVVVQVNELREKMENGHNIRLLPCPSTYNHGSIEHARWLFKTVKKDANVAYAACATQLNNPVTAEERASLAAGHDKCGVPKKDDTLTITPEAALQWLTERTTDTNRRVNKLDCPHCSQSWLVNSLQNYPRHKCNKIYKEVMVLPYKLALQAKVEAEAEADDPNQILNYSAGVTRTLASTSISWELGDRITGEDEFWTREEETVKKRPRRNPVKSDPEHVRTIDHLGRLHAACLTRTRLEYPHEVLNMPECRTELIDEATQTLKNPQGYVIETISSYIQKNPDFNGRLIESDAAKVDECKDELIFLRGEAKPLWQEEQIRAILRRVASTSTPPDFGLDTIRLAVAERLKEGTLRANLE